MLMLTAGTKNDKIGFDVTGQRCLHYGAVVLNAIKVTGLVIAALLVWGQYTPCPRGGMIGTAPPIKIPIMLRGVGDDDGDCAQVDVWIPADMANAQQAPTINDPNASVTLDITPSPNGRDCSIWHYHYLKKGERPPTVPREVNHPSFNL